MGKGPFYATKIINFSDWISSIITSDINNIPHPTTPVRNDLNKGNYFSACYRYTSIESCNDGNSNCRFHEGCNFCVPKLYSKVPYRVLGFDYCSWILKRIQSEYDK